MSLVSLTLYRSVLLLLIIPTFGSASWELNEAQKAASKPKQQAPAAYELSLGDILPASFFDGEDTRSYNFLNGYFRLVGGDIWPVSPELVQSLHYITKRTCSTTRFICNNTISLNDRYQGPCKEECQLSVYPTISDGDACRQCGEKHAIWHHKSYAGLDLVAVVNYTRHSMLIGTTMTSFARDVTKALHSADIPVFCYALDYQPQPIAAMVAPYKPLAPLALKADAWDIAFTVSGSDVIPFCIENENRILGALNSMGLASLFTSFWRFKNIIEDSKKGLVTLNVILTRQPDRHGQMSSEAAALAMKQLEQKLHGDGIGWHTNFLAARFAPEETLAGRFKVLAEDQSFKIKVWLVPGIVTLLVAAVTALLLLGSPGMIIMPWRHTTYGSGSSDASSNSGFGSGGSKSILRLSGSGLRIAKAVPLIMGDTVEKADIEICKSPTGDGDWLLGSGASGRVYKGIKNGVQDVAVKVLINSDDVQVRLFQEEIKLLRSVSFDRNIVQFCGACLQPHDTMMVLEYMAGGDLMRAISTDTKNELRWSRRGGLLMLDIARGLAFLHANRLIHMDLKSKNILLNARKDLAKIADVGLSRIIQSTLGGQSANPFSVGTFEYTAPEILLGRYCTEKVDVYSFGVIMWEVITHEQPARGRMRELRVPEDCPAEIDSLVTRCMSEQPEGRPSAKEAYDTLKAWRDSHAAFLREKQASMQRRGSSEIVTSGTLSLTNTDKSCMTQGAPSQATDPPSQEPDGQQGPSVEI